MNQYIKTINILQLLSRKKYVKSVDIQNLLEIGSRQAQKIIRELTYLDFISWNESNNTVSLVENFDIKHSILEYNEVGASSVFLNILKEYSDKFESGFLEDLSNRILRNNKALSIYYPMLIGIKTPQNYFEIKEKIEEAILDRKQINFYYKTKDKYYEIYPFKIIITVGLWYLLGQKGNSLRLFKLEFIEDLQSHGVDEFEIPENIEDILHNSKSIWSITNEQKEDITIHIESEMGSQIIANRNRGTYFTNQKILKIYPDNSVDLQFSVANEKDFKHQVYKWLPFVKVLTPLHYVGIHKKDLKINLKKYY